MALLDVSFVVEALSDRTLTVTVPSADTVNAAGEIIRGSTTSQSVRGSLQPATGRDLKGLPEGQRTNETKVLFSTSALRTRDGTKPPYAIAISGEGTFEVVNVADFSSLGGYYRYLIQRKPGP
jgi:hypothetical protein